MQLDDASVSPDGEPRLQQRTALLSGVMLSFPQFL